MTGAQGPWVVLVHGFPDSSALWNNLITHLPNHRCLCVTLPLHGDDSLDQTSWGPSFAQLDDMFTATVSKHCGDDSVTLVAHDWGTELAYRFERRFPERVTAVVGLDVGPALPSRTQLGLSGIVMIVAYQWWLLLAYLIWHWIPVFGKFVGNSMTSVFARLAGAPGASQRRYVAAQNYFYFNFWLGARLHARRPSAGRRRLPLCPMLFVYGRRKPVMFHNPEILSAADNVRIIEADCGHWVMLDPRVVAQIVAFLA